ncbi:MAG: hypothetical protein WDA08_04215 [Weeksellaceae bacterium]
MKEALESLTKQELVALLISERETISRYQKKIHEIELEEVAQKPKLRTMNRFLFIFYLLLMGGFVSAQEKDSLSQAEKERREHNIQVGNPFKKYGYTPKIATLSKGKYLEWHDLDSIVIIGSVYYNTKSKKIIDFVERDMTNPDAQPLSDIRGRWISPDPLAEEFPSWSPYAFVYNNPLRFNDPTGMAPEDIYKLNADGTLTWMSESNTDVVHAAKDFNSDGTVQSGAKGVEVGEKGFVKDNTQVYAVNGKDSEGNTSDKHTTLNFGGNESKALEYFKFAAENTNVEFNILTDNSTTVVGTTNLPFGVFPFNDKQYVGLNSGYDTSGISLYGHSHSVQYGAAITPSGFEVSITNSKANTFSYSKLGFGGDRLTATSFPNSTNNFVYAPKYIEGAKTVHYNGNSVLSIQNGFKPIQK